MSAQREEEMGNLAVHDSSHLVPPGSRSSFWALMVFQGRHSFIENTKFFGDFTRILSPAFLLISIMLCLAWRFCYLVPPFNHQSEAVLSDIILLKMSLGQHLHHARVPLYGNTSEYFQLRWSSRSKTEDSDFWDRFSKGSIFKICNTKTYSWWEGGRQDAWEGCPLSPWALLGHGQLAQPLWKTA